MDQTELQRLRKTFASINTRDPDQLRKWFEDHFELSIAEHSKIAGRSGTTVSKWRRRCGYIQLHVAEGRDGVLIGKRIGPSIKQGPKPLPDIQVPPNWEMDAQWMWDIASRISYKQLARLIGCSYRRSLQLAKWAERRIPQSVVDLIHGQD